MTVGAAEPLARWDLASVLGLIREGSARTIPELTRLSGSGRKGVTQRVEQLIAYGLLREGDLGTSTGGRAPREITFCADRGRVLVCELDSTKILVGLADLAGTVLSQRQDSVAVDSDADAVLGHIEGLFEKLLDEDAAHAAAEGREPSPLWGIGLGVLGPVDIATGKPVALGRTVPGWGDYPVRDRLEARFRVPVWLDNEANLMALGEYRAGLGRQTSNLLYVKVGLGIGAGLISEGRLHRGADGTAGELGHIVVTDDPSAICRCGQVGCLFAVAGGLALIGAGRRAAADGRSPALAAVVETGQTVALSDLVDAALDGDLASIDIFETAGDRIGRVIATVINIFNPRLVLVGGEVAAVGDLLLAAVRQAVYRHAMPLATRSLRVELSPLSNEAGLVGAAFLVLDQIFSPELLPMWVDHGSPADFTVANLQGPPTRSG